MQVQSVGIQKGRIKIVAVAKVTKRETHLDVEFNQQLHTFVTSTQLLAKAFDVKLEGDFKQSLLSKVSLSAEYEVEIRGNKIHKITAA